MPHLTDVAPLSGVVLDHVAVAVADRTLARTWWTDLGAVPVVGVELRTFSSEQLKLSNGGKVELIGRGLGADGSFIDGFLDRFGSGSIHHITLKVPGPLTAAIAHLREAGLDVVDVATDAPYWHESFLRPSQVGGLIVQVAWADGTDADFARRQGRPPPAAADPDAPAFEEVVVGSTDLDRAEAVWRLLGAKITAVDADERLATFTGSPVAVRLRRHDTAGPLGLRLSDVEPAPATPHSPSMLGR